MYNTLLISLFFFFFSIICGWAHMVACKIPYLKFVCRSILRFEKVFLILFNWHILNIYLSFFSFWHTTQIHWKEWLGHRITGRISKKTRLCSPTTKWRFLTHTNKKKNFAHYCQVLPFIPLWYLPGKYVKFSDNKHGDITNYKIEYKVISFIHTLVISSLIEAA